ncbi:MAG: phosphoglucosamine mutase [Verrucomicrobiales bacterium]
MNFFGTDGVRGTANIENLSPESALRLAQFATKELITSQVETKQSVIIGKDTRRSGDMIESALASGFNSAGINVKLAGIVPTPAIAMLVKEIGASLGVVVSASHNPAPDNGIKFFFKDGYKLSKIQEASLEKRILSDEQFIERPISDSIGTVERLKDGIEIYVDKVTKSFSKTHNSSSPLKGIKISLDAANGASFKSSSMILEQLGADLICHHNTPNGDNINEACGCTHPEVISKIVKKDQSFIGISHDGDADRILMCDENAKPIDGDELMAIIGCHMLSKGLLQSKTLVATKMSNFGLDECISNNGGKVERADIGDRNVMEVMKKIGSNFGGEPSGHIICKDHNTTGDGIIAALAALSAVIDMNQPLSELRKCLKKFPQKLINLDIGNKISINELEAKPLIEETEKSLGNEGQVLIRYSGTEPKIRILVEGKDHAYVESQASKIADSIHNQIGV